MKAPDDFFERLKWSIYEWIGTISVEELAENTQLATEIERLCKRLHSIQA